jgi:hypothetical protein
MANRVWDEPLFSRTFEGTGRTLSESEVRDTVDPTSRCLMRHPKAARDVTCLDLGHAEGTHLQIGLDNKQTPGH